MARPRVCDTPLWLFQPGGIVWSFFFWAKKIANGETPQILLFLKKEIHTTPLYLFWGVCAATSLSTGYNFLMILYKSVAS
jgi:hypothetical protein